MDICSCETAVIEPGHHSTVKTGLTMDIQKGVYGRTVARIGFASRSDI